MVDILRILAKVLVFLLYVPTLAVIAGGIEAIGFPKFADWVWGNPIGRWLLNDRN